MNIPCGRLREVKNKRNLQTVISKFGVAAVTYERWSLTRDSNYCYLTGNILVFWKRGRLREVVARGGSTVSIALLATM